MAADLKTVYRASIREEAQDALDAFAKKYDNWTDLSTFFDYPKDIRREVYSSNVIESLNMSLRKVTKTKGGFPNDGAIFKILYLALRNAAKKWTMSIQNWHDVMNQFSIMFPAYRSRRAGREERIARLD